MTVGRGSDYILAVMLAIITYRYIECHRAHSLFNLNFLSFSWVTVLSDISEQLVVSRHRFPCNISDQCYENNILMVQVFKANA